MSTSDGATSFNSQSFWRKWGWRIAIMNAAATVILLVTFLISGMDAPGTETCVKNVVDFHVFWAAGRLSFFGTPLTAFDQVLLGETIQSCNQNWLPWLHPAPAMVLLTPFGSLPFHTAWAAFNLVSIAALAVAMRQFLPLQSPVFLVILLAPAVLPALLAGQFTLLWMAGLLGALAALRADRPVIAGVLIGLLTIKPTLGLLIPVALLAIQAWRTIGVATLTAVVINGLSTAIYGVAYWANWRDVNTVHIGATISEMGERDVMASVAAFLAHLGVAPTTAVIFNLALAAGLAILVFVVWRRLGHRSDIAAAVLFASIPLATPYLWLYDAAFLAIVAMFLQRQNTMPVSLLYGIALVALWFGPGLGVWIFATVGFDWVTPVWTVPPILLLALCLTIRRAATSLSSDSNPERTRHNVTAKN